MYRRAIVHYCGETIVENYAGLLLRKNEILVEVKYTYMSIADEALTQCSIISRDYKRVLGSIAIGKVLRIGVESYSISEGDRVVVFPILGHAPIEIDGACQDIYNIDSKYALVSSQKAFSDLEMLFIALLSINKKLLDLVKGFNTLIVGNDLSILPFAFYSMLYSSKLAIIPKYTLWPEIIKGEHISIYNGTKKIDVIILASSDPLVNSIVLKSFRDASIIIVHPSILSMLKLDASLFSDSSDKYVTTMKFGDIATGMEVFNEFREYLAKRVELLSLNDIPRIIRAPLIIQIS